MRKSYDGSNYVVRGLDLVVPPGEFLTLLGPSGSGKTTTLMMLAGFETPTSGTITLDGRRIDGVPPHRRNIGVVFQNYALFPHMTVGENIGFPLKMRGIERSELAQRVRRALDMVRMDKFETRRPNQLSGGQQQRIALARALVFEPKLVLMDEPLGALDKQLREHMQIEIKHLHARLGVNVVYVTHDQSEALTMSDRIGVFNDGTLQQLAAPATLYDSPANAFVATFIGENNTIAGRMTGLERGAMPDRDARWWRDRCDRERRTAYRRQLDFGAAARAHPARSCRGRHRQSLHQPRRGADLSRRPRPPASGRLRLRRHPRQGSGQPNRSRAFARSRDRNRLAHRGLPRPRAVVGPDG